ncbi:MAG TPA: NIPSNAP family protein [Ginsengibacter sp.]
MISIIKTGLITAIFLTISLTLFAKGPHDFYQIKIFHCKTDSQLKQVNDYLENEYLPVLHRFNIKDIGVFEPIGNDTASNKMIYVLIPFTSEEEWLKIDENLLKDITYATAAKDFLSAPADEAPYVRMESILLEAFSGQEKLLLPTTKDTGRVFELRSYESPTENLLAKKMAMFNKDEINIFNRLGFNPVFYGRVVSGSHMPNLMYMPIFKSVEERNAQWKVFGNDAKWKEISADPENENKVSVSHIDSILMHSTSYSDY